MYIKSLPCRKIMGKWWHPWDGTLAVSPLQGARWKGIYYIRCINGVDLLRQPTVPKGFPTIFRFKKQAITGTQSRSQLLSSFYLQGPNYRGFDWMKLSLGAWKVEGLMILRGFFTSVKVDGQMLMLSFLEKRLSWSRNGLYSVFLFYIDP